MYVADLKVHDKIVIGEGKEKVIVRVEHKSGKNARLSFDADRGVKIRKMPATEAVNDN